MSAPDVNETRLLPGRYHKAILVVASHNTNYIILLPSPDMKLKFVPGEALVLRNARINEGCSSDERCGISHSRGVLHVLP